MLDLTELTTMNQELDRRILSLQLEVLFHVEFKHLYSMKYSYPGCLGPWTQMHISYFTRSECIALIETNQITTSPHSNIK